MDYLRTDKLQWEKGKTIFRMARHLQCRKPNGDLTKLSHYKEYKQFFKNAIERAKLLYHLDKFDENFSNSKNTWKVINELCGTVKSQSKEDLQANNFKQI